VPLIEKVDVSAYVVPTDFPESDGTFEWNSTTVVLAEVHAGSEKGIGYTYASIAAAETIRHELAPAIVGLHAMDIPAAMAAMRGALRNNGCTGVGAMALSAIDVALWDIKARLLGTPLGALLGRARERVPIYGSGGFTSYAVPQLEAQLRAWVDQGIWLVKMKIGRDPTADLTRVASVWKAISAASENAELMVDANGAYDAKQAIGLAHDFARAGVVWFEEPVPSGDSICLRDLRFVKERVPMDVAGGEYGYRIGDFQQLLPAVDVLQADATRCLGITGFLQAAHAAFGANKTISAHCAPTIHRHLGASVENFKHLEWFHDHVRIERLFFDGFVEPKGGFLVNDHERPGLGIEVKRADAEKYRAG